MRVAIVSDIHGNRHAFEAVLESIDASECHEMWCLGDLVGYGGSPDECVQLARNHASICLAGNHDLGVIGTIPLEDFSRGAALAARWTQEVISPGSVGQPRDGDPRAAWLELDLDDWTALFHRLEYDIAGAQGAIHAARLPNSLAERLQYGQ